MMIKIIITHEYKWEVPGGNQQEVGERKERILEGEDQTTLHGYIFMCV
jgi:hypothetical protein